MQRPQPINIAQGIACRIVMKNGSGIRHGAYADTIQNNPDYAREH